MTEDRIIAYLLEELPEEEAERFEDECFAGENWPAQINLVEEDLIDDYLRDRLVPERRESFERNYLNTDARVERVRMAAALLRHVDGRAAADAPILAAPSKEKTGRAWGGGALWGGRLSVARTALAAALLVAVIAGAFLASRLVIAPSKRAVVMLVLTPASADRGGGGNGASKVKLPSDAGALRVSLMLPEGSFRAARYRVEFEDDKGETSSLDSAGHDAQSVTVVIPAPRLTRGRYALRLFAVNADGAEQRINGSYLFSIE
jgi:hypothetical protein